MPLTSDTVDSLAPAGIGRCKMIFCSPCRIIIGLAPRSPATAIIDVNDGTTANVGSTFGPRPS